jgi:serine/threonine protein kinase
MRTMTTPRDDAPVGSVLDGKYLLLAAIGGGRFGAVYRATHIALQKTVAVKVLHGADRLAARDFEQFRVEAEALGRLAHPNIVGVIDFGVDPRGDGTPYLVMELVEGETLADTCAREGAIDLQQAAPWLAQIAAALDHAHASGVAHGDLSAKNVLLVGSGAQATPKVIDFGLARLVEAPSAATGGGADAPPYDSATSGGAKRPPSDPATRVAAEAPPRDSISRRFAGTPQYTAPERFRGDAPSPASDVYAFAVLAYRLLAGRHPFEGDTATVLRAHLTVAPATLDASVVGPVGAAAIAGGLAKRAADRPSALDLARALSSAARDQARVRWRRREVPRRLAWSAIAAMALAAAEPGLASSDLVQRIEGATRDVRFALSSPKTPSPGLLLVSIDDESLARDGRPLSARGDAFGAALDLAFERGASVAALDLLLPEPWSQAERFADLVLTRADRLVLAAASVGDAIVGPEAIDRLTAAALGSERASRLFGLVSHSAAPDGVIRQARATVIDRDGQARATFTGRVNQLLQNGRASMQSQTSTFLIDYSIDAARFDRLPWHAFEQALADGRRFDDRVVIVGAEYTGSGDRHRVPGPGRMPADVSGLAVQAIAIDTLARGRPLVETSGAALWAATSASLFVAAQPILWFRRLNAAFLATVAVFVGTGAASVAAFRAGLVVNVAAPALLGLVLVIAAIVARSRMAPHPE